VKYDFDQLVDRRNTNSVKWDSDSEPDRLPMWVADMDFRTAEPIIRALEARAKQGIFGYAGLPDAYYEAEAGWWQRRHGCSIEKDWVLVTTGVIPSLSAAVQAFAAPGDRVLLQSPVYNYFNSSITNNGCEIVRSELAWSGERYEMDFADFERKAADDRVKLFLLCNPHNPVGRAWSRQELERIGDICLRHGVRVVSDEIHRDLVYRGSRHVPFASLGERHLLNSITCTAPSKTFNLAGLKTSSIIVADPELRGRLDRALNVKEAIEPNAFGIDALIAAYTEGEDWLEQMLDYVEGNRDEALAFLQERLPQLRAVVPEATYLLWVDVRALGIGSRELAAKLWEEASLRINEGSVYGPSGEGYLRINLACPRALLRDGLQRLERVIASLS
jgi:cystathionine beta-lyase